MTKQCTNEPVDWFDISWLDGRPHAILPDGIVPVEKVYSVLRKRARTHLKTVTITVIDGEVYLKATGEIPAEKVVPTHAYFTDNLAIVQR